MNLLMSFKRDASDLLMPAARTVTVTGANGEVTPSRLSSSLHYESHSLPFRDAAVVRACAGVMA